MSARRIGILGTGAFAPANVLTNKDLEKLVDTDDQWIRDRTGISDRRVCGPDEGVASLAIEAARRALESAQIAPDRLSYIILGTNSPDYLYPAIAIRVQDEPKAPRFEKAIKALFGGWKKEQPGIDELEIPRHLV